MFKIEFFFFFFLGGGGGIDNWGVWGGGGALTIGW
jgi:hypothetical protein